MLFLKRFLKNSGNVSWNVLFSHAARMKSGRKKDAGWDSVLDPLRLGLLPFILLE